MMDIDKLITELCQRIDATAHDGRGVVTIHMAGETQPLHSEYGNEILREIIESYLD